MYFIFVFEEKMSGQRYFFFNNVNEVLVIELYFQLFFFVKIEKLYFIFNGIEMFFKFDNNMFILLFNR